MTVSGVDWASIKLGSTNEPRGPEATQERMVVGGWVNRKGTSLPPPGPPPPAGPPGFACQDPLLLGTGWDQSPVPPTWDGEPMGTGQAAPMSRPPVRTSPLGCCYCQLVHWDQSAVAFLAAPNHCKPGNQEVKDTDEVFTCQKKFTNDFKNSLK